MLPVDPNMTQIVSCACGERDRLIASPGLPSTLRKGRYKVVMRRIVYRVHVNI